MGKFDRKKLDNLQQAYDNLHKKSHEKTKIYGKRNAKVKSLKKERDELKQELSWVNSNHIMILCLKD